MNIALIIIISFLIIILFLFVVFLFLSKRQTTTLTTIDESGKIKENNENDKMNSKLSTNKDNINSNNNKTTKEDYKKEDVYKLMEFDRILDDMIVQKGGSRFTMAIQCKGINYDLMSEVEQLSVEEGFITFLNTLKYPIQLYVQAQNIDLKKAIDKYKDNIEPLKEKYDNINNEYTKIASAFDADERQLQTITKEKDSISNVYEYGMDIIKYVEKMSVNKNLLQRKFFVLVSYNTSEIVAIDKFNKDEIVEMCSTELITRCRAIISALSSCSVSGKILTSNELADLLYSAYNRDDKGIMSVKEAIDSGFFRLYSTSEDAFIKRNNALEEYIKNEAKLKALNAMKEVIESGKINTEASEALEIEEDISRKATNMVKNSDYDPDFEKAVNKKILDDFREKKKELSEEDAKQREVIIEKYKNDLEEAKNTKVEKPNGVKLIEKSKESYNSKIDIDNNSNKEIQNSEQVEINKNEIEKKNEDSEEGNLYSLDNNDNNDDDESIV